MKFKYIVIHENNSDEFDIEHCRTKVKVKVSNLAKLIKAIENITLV